MCERVRVRIGRLDAHIDALASQPHPPDFEPTERGEKSARDLLGVDSELSCGTGAIDVDTHLRLCGVVVDAYVPGLSDALDARLDLGGGDLEFGELASLDPNRECRANGGAFRELIDVELDSGVVINSPAQLRDHLGLGAQSLLPVDELHGDASVFPPDTPPIPSVSVESTRVSGGEDPALHLGELCELPRDQSAYASRLLEARTERLGVVQRELRAIRGRQKDRLDRSRSEQQTRRGQGDGCRADQGSSVPEHGLQ